MPSRTGTLSWCDRRWKALGVQRLPEKLALRGPEDVAMWIGESARWERAQSRYRALIARWPVLAQQLPRYFDVLADYSDADYQRLTEMLDWIASHPNSNLYPRQLPVSGLDSKWLDGRKGLLTDLVDEAAQHSAAELTLLTKDEQQLYWDLKLQRWGQNVRLEQERIDWTTAWNVLQRSLA